MGRLYYQDPVSGIMTPMVTSGPTGPTGPTGADGAAGIPGGSVLSGWWTYIATTTGPALTGQIRTTDGTVGNTITVWLHPTDADGLDWSLVTLEVDQQLILRSATGESWMLTVTAVPGNTEITCILDSSTSTAPKKNQRVQVSLVNDPVGVTGPTGPTGPAAGATYVGDYDPVPDPALYSTWVVTP